ncbi:hypothetical protein MNBD_ALPHA06-685, partial [hydrothermal vent metagenome]
DPTKEEKSYDANLRKEDMARIQEEFAADLEQTRHWIQRVPLGGFDIGNFPFPLEL